MDEGVCSAAVFETDTPVQKPGRLKRAAVDRKGHGQRWATGHGSGAIVQIFKTRALQRTVNDLQIRRIVKYAHAGAQFGIASAREHVCDSKARSANPPAYNAVVFYANAGLKQEALDGRPAVFNVSSQFPVALRKAGRTGENNTTE